MGLGESGGESGEGDLLVGSEEIRWWMRGFGRWVVRRRPVGGWGGRLVGKWGERDLLVMGRSVRRRPAGGWFG